MTMQRQRQYIAIDLKSFYASVECAQRGLDPLTTNLVVADASRTDKTICLAVSPSLKSYGISGRARLFEVVERVRQVNEERLCFSPEGIFTATSTDDTVVRGNPACELNYIVAPPRMSLYMQTSAQIYSIYLRHIAPEDIHVYSVDEVFIDATDYLDTYRLSAHQLAIKLIREVLRETGITATAGIGTNLYLAKVAMDIVAKHIPADSDGVRIAELDEMSFRRQLWDHQPMTDFWRIGHGTAKRLKTHGISTMGELARLSLTDEAMLYKEFGIAAELLIDHAWGWEPTTMADIKAYRPTSNSFSSGQVLTEPYPADKARIVVREMASELSLRLVANSLTTSQISLYVGYDSTDLDANGGNVSYDGPVALDHYGRPTPAPANGSANLRRPTSSTRAIGDAVVALFDRIVNNKLHIRRMYIGANNLLPSGKGTADSDTTQLNMFDDPAEVKRRQAEQKAALEREKRMSKAELAIRQTFGKNAILRGTDLEEGATARDRNRQIGGHKA